MAKRLKELYDVVVVGEGPAAAAAALAARRGEATVLVVDPGAAATSGPSVGWLGPEGVTACREFGLGAKQAGASEFQGLGLYSWDLKRNTEVAEPDLQGWLVDYASFNAALLKQAQKAGAEVISTGPLRAVNLGEEQATLELDDGRTVNGRVLLIGDGIDSPTARMAGMHAAGEMRDVPTCLFTECETKDKTARFQVAVGANRRGQLATIKHQRQWVSLAITARAARADLEILFRTFRAEAIENGLVPRELPQNPRLINLPGGAALDMDTHVGKRCLLIGDTGGFIAAFSSETIYPAMKSAVIAAQTALHAIEADVVQDELASFGTAWRQELADYLRMPNTDLSLLVPLVFNNARMSSRVARAFLLGRPF